MIKRRWKKLAGIALALYILIGAAIYFFQDRILFRPAPLAAGYQYHFKEPFKEVMIPVSNTSSISLVQFASADTGTRGVVLYFHGNRDNILRYAHFASNFTKHGYEVWMMDYPGYGKSTGVLTEKTMYEWALQVYKLARSRFPFERIIIYGKSLGTGLATQLAATRNCKRVILETPFYSVPSLANRYFFIYPIEKLMHYQFPNWQYLQQIEVPVTIFQGTSDMIVPYSNAERLKPFLKTGDEFVTIPNAGHNDCYAYPQTIQKLDSILN